MISAGIRVGEGDALLVVDVQNDFLPGCKLAVPRGDEVVAVLNGYLALARRQGIGVFASRDWHPAGHCSFASRGGPWPVHCVAGTPGAAFAPGLELPAEAVIVDKGTQEDAEAYSAFAGTDLARRLREFGVKRLLIGGLATDYCVLASVRDALREGFEVLVLEDAVRAVNASAADGELALREMQDKGAMITRLEDCA